MFNLNRENPEEFKILFINSYHDGYKWSDDVLDGIKTIFFSEDLNIDLRIEYMDSQRNPGKEYLEKLYEFYKTKFFKAKYDLVISSDDAAFNLVMEKGDTFFPDTPIVFCGINSYQPELLKDKNNITGVVEGLDIQKTLDLALTLHPEKKNIYYIIDNSLSGVSTLIELNKITETYNKEITISKLKGDDLQELTKEASLLKNDSLILYLLYFNDEKGRHYNFREGIREISSASPVPVFGLWDFHLGYGIEGGKLTSGFYQGKTAAEMAVKILKGTHPSDIEIKTEETTEYKFDFHEMQKFSLDTDKLPEKSSVINYKQNNKKQVLLLHSYHRGLTWTDDIESGIREKLDTSETDVELIIDYLDLKRNPEPVYYREIFELMQKKYETKQFDAIITSDDDAFEFIVQFEKTLAEPVPVIFCGINNYNPQKWKNYPWATGVTECFDIENTLLSALKMKKGINKVIVINDTTLTGKANRKKIEHLLPVLQKKSDIPINFDFWENLNMSEIQKRVQTLEESSIVLIMTFNRDKSNNYFSYSESIRLISEQSTVPVFGVWDFLLGKGITGGKLISGRKNGELTGELSLKILEGQHPSDIPVITTAPNAYMFDLDLLNKYEISLKDIPPDSIIINKPLSLSQYIKVHKEEFKILSLIFLLLIIIIMIPVIIILRKSILQRNNLLKEKELILHEVHHRIKNNMLTTKNLLTMQAMNTEHISAREILNDAGSRIQSMGILYDKLYRSENIQNISLNEYLPDLAKEIINLFPKNHTIELHTNIEPIIMNAKSISNLGIIINELITNIMKYAFTNQQSGKIILEAVKTGKSIVITLEDNGSGIPESVSFSSTNGFGLTLVQILVEQLNGSVEIDRKNRNRIILVFNRKLGL